MSWTIAQFQSAKVIAVTSAVLLTACGPASMDRLRPDIGNPLPAGVVRDPAAFRASLGAFRPGKGNTRDRNSTKCFLWMCSDLSVTIEAIGNTNDIDPAKPPAAGTGFPAARLINNDARKIEKFYHLRPGSEAEYFLWVTRKDQDETQWTLIEVPRVGGQVTAATPTDLRYCNPRMAGEAKTSEADFAQFRHGGKCSIKYPKTASGAPPAVFVNTSSISFIQPLLRALHSLLLTSWNVAEGGWIDCSNGCCT
jgi:hypothetical protein